MGSDPITSSSKVRKATSAEHVEIENAKAAIATEEPIYKLRVSNGRLRIREVKTKIDSESIQAERARRQFKQKKMKDREGDGVNVDLFKLTNCMRHTPNHQKYIFFRLGLSTEIRGESSRQHV